MTRFVYLLFAYFFLVLALIGLLVPGIPTVPFLLLTAWFAARGSERLHRWLYEHRYFGKLLQDWESQGAISRNAKIGAVSMMMVSWVVMYLQIDAVWLIAVVSVVFAVLIAFLVSRPEPH